MELLRDRSTELDEEGLRAFGISRDSPWTHIAWSQALDLNFPLLSDWNAEAVHGFGVAHDYHGYGDVAPGDHLQTSYRFWLFGHQLEHGHAPWLDPYSFRPEAAPTVNFTAWPFAIPYWPLEAVAGPVIAWNVFVLASYVLAGLFSCAWLRGLGLPRIASLAGGLAFAIAPYRTAQSLGHLLGPVSALLPLALYAVERARRGSGWWLAPAAGGLAPLSPSRQGHRALPGDPFFFA